MRIGLLAVLPLALLAACTDADGARDVLDAAGYRSIQIRERGWFSNCGEHDHYATPFAAVGPTGRAVEGVVRAQGSWGKGATIRITHVGPRVLLAPPEPLPPGVVR